ncbi:MAG: hypothetical protein ACXU9U_01650 [Parachlamydiaceae bacterium]
MRLVRILMALAACSALQLPSLYARTPFFQEPAPFNFQVYGGFREDYLKLHIGADTHKNHMFSPLLDNKHFKDSSDQESFKQFHRRCKEKDPCFVGPCDEDPCGFECFEEQNRKHDKKNLKNFSKVEWTSLKISQIGASINYSTGNHYYMRASGDYGRIFQGKGVVTNRFTILRTPAFPHHHHEHHHHHKHHHKGRVHAKNAHEIAASSEELPSFPQAANLGLDQHHHRSRKHHHKHRHHHPEKNIIHYHRLNEVSRQTADADHGNVCDLSGGLGWKVISGGGRAWIAGIIGYSYEHQNLTMKNFKVRKDSYQIVAPDALDGLKATYQTRWVGPWVGIDFASKVECDVTLFGTVEYHYADYRGNGTWRQSNRFCANMHQHAKGYGVVGTLGFDWAPCDQWGIGLLFNYQQWSTRRGNNHSSIKTQQPGTQELISTFPIAEKSTFYRAKWVTFAVALEASYRY